MAPVVAAWDLRSIRLWRSWVSIFSHIASWVVSDQLRDDSLVSFLQNAENSAFNHEDTMNQPAPYAELIATFRRAETEAAHKFGLIKTLSNKGPKAIQAAVDTADKAAKRRDSYAKRLKDLGVDVNALR